MTPASKAKKIAHILDELFPQVAIPLQHHDPFTLLVAVMLSAQSTDKKVNEVTPRLFARAGSAPALAAMPVAAIEALIHSLGLAPQKAKALQAMARLLVKRHGARVPKTFTELEALPGVGHKTASVVLLQAFGKPAFPVDTHIHRLAARWGLSSGRSVTQTEADLKKLFPRRRWGKLHLQFIFFGRQYCPARGHQAAKCPICSWAATPQPASSAPPQPAQG